MDFPLLSQESIDNHHLDPVRILQDFHRYVQNALTADENSHPRDNDPVFQAKMNKDSRPPIPKSTKGKLDIVINIKGRVNTFKIPPGQRKNPFTWKGLRS
ncbi:unnamed protein product [Eretmochelys imbricata]